MSVNGDWFRDPDKFVELTRDVLSRTDLTPATKLIYADISSRIDGNEEAWPSLRSLARSCGLSAGTVAEAIKSLESVGLIEREQCGRDGKDENYRYRVFKRAENLERPRMTLGPWVIALSKILKE